MIALLVSGHTHACTPVLGFEIQTSTFEDVNDSLSKQTKVVDSGINKFSNGAMLKTDSSCYEIEGLNEVLYVFDDQKNSLQSS